MGALVTPAHISAARHIIQESAKLDSGLTEKELRSYLQVRSCQFLSKLTGLPYDEVVEIYELYLEESK